MLKLGNELCAGSHTVACCEPLAVKRDVYFILNDNNIQRISWGVKKIKTDGKDKEFLKLTSKKVAKYMTRDYVETFEKEDRIGSTSFRKIYLVIKNHDKKAKVSVDYIARVLLYDNFKLFRRIKWSRSEKVEIQKLEEIIEALDALMKGHYESHAYYCYLSKPTHSFHKINSIYAKCEIC